MLVLCNTGLYGIFGCSIACIMAKSASEAASAYRDGISQIGADTYRRASQATSPSEAAEILEDAKQDRLDLDTMVSNYRDAY